MNRYKKEEKKKYDEARKGLTKEEIITQDLKDEISEKIRSRARAIHIEKFPEEYDMIGDSSIDANERARGINPMSQEYIDKINKKRKSVGVPPLSDNGVATSDITFQMCLEEARVEVLSDLTLKRPPSLSCISCKQAISKIGGKRIVAQDSRGLRLVHKNTESIKKGKERWTEFLFPNETLVMECWGEEAFWTQQRIESAEKAFLKGEHPWFCQVCGNRKCDACGSPAQIPMRSDVIYGDGNILHTPIFPFESGCINATCNKYNSSK